MRFYKFIFCTMALISLSSCRSIQQRSTVTERDYNDQLPLHLTAPPRMTIDVKKNYTAVIDTVHGEIVIQLRPDFAPNTVNNFVFLAREGFYNRLKFYRVEAGSFIQGGSPSNQPIGGPGYVFKDEIKNNPLKHDRGVISMSNRGPNTNGSQFFITIQQMPSSNGLNTVFGTVTSDMGVVENIRENDEMISITIIEN